MDTQLLRQAIRRQRRALTVSQQRVAAIQLYDQLMTLRPVLNAKHIALYLANDGEIDPSVFMQRALERGVYCYLPVLSTKDDVPMHFAEFNAQSELRNNRFGIAEPAVADCDLIEAAKLDVILMPLVAFDDAGNRVGMGGGFYDRTLAFKAQQTYYRPPDLIGLAHSLQQQQQIFAATWDVPLDGIATEQTAKLFREVVD